MSMILALVAAVQAASPLPAVQPDSVAKPVIAPDRLAAAKRLIAMIKLERTFDLMFVQLAPNFAHAVIGSMATEPGTKGLIETLTSRAPENRDRMAAIISQEFLRSIQKRYPALLDKAAEEYAAVFTADELTAIADFYASGPGAKVLALTPQLQATMGKHGEALGAEAGAEAGRRAFERIAREMLPANEVQKS